MITSYVSNRMKQEEISGVHEALLCLPMKLYADRLVNIWGA